MTKILFAILIIAISACSDVEFKSAGSSQYFDMDSLVGLQIDKLIAGSYQIQKTATIDDQQESKILEFDSMSWARELDAVSGLNLNLPRYVGAIETKEEGNKVIYTPKAGQNLMFRGMELQFDDSGSLLSVSGEILDDRAELIYTTTQTISLEFEAGLLTKYQVSGFQKMIMNDTTWFEVKGEIIPK